MATQRPTAEVLDQLREGIATLTSSDKWAQWLRAQRRFHNYSFGNSLLILLQRPEATRVAGYQTWRKLGRQVRKGEKGIVILAPVAPRIRVEDENGDEQVIAGPAQTFRTAHVFDMAQTEGPDLPSVVERLEGDDPDRIFLQLVKAAASIGYSVEFADFLDERNGDCTFVEHRIRVRQGLSPAQAVKTLAHELAHAVLHGADFAGARPLAELEAESVAYMVCADLGIDSSEYSFGYLVTWSGGGHEACRAISESAHRIQRAAQLILSDSAASAAERAA
jgi:antirestriction protein ArdC